jgi:hypothetical protein
LNSRVDALSRESAISSWFCREARRSSTSNQRDNMPRPTGISIAMAMTTHSRRVKGLRKIEL